MIRKALILSLQNAITQKLIDSPESNRYLTNTNKEQVSCRQFLEYIKTNNDEDVYNYLKNFSAKKIRKGFRLLDLKKNIQEIKKLAFSDLQDTVVADEIRASVSSSASSAPAENDETAVLANARDAAQSPALSPELKNQILQGIILKSKARAASTFVEPTAALTQAANDPISVIAEPKSESPKKRVTFADDVLAHEVKNLGQNSFFSMPECLIPGFNAKIVISSIAVLGAATMIGLMCAAGPHFALILATVVFAAIAAAGIYSLRQECLNDSASSMKA